jgi:hypothetical protein
MEGRDPDCPAGDQVRSQALMHHPRLASRHEPASHRRPELAKRQNIGQHTNSDAPNGFPREHLFDPGLAHYSRGRDR